MMIEIVKLRDAQYCNLKLLLIFLVIYGHLIESMIWQSEVLMVQYRWMYLVHMPLFCFLSGLFLNNAKVCKKQLARIFPLYILLQTFAVVIGNGEVNPLTPYWHLWYLLSYSIWLCLAWTWFRFCNGKGKIIILICSIVVGCVAGLVPFIGRELSLSRTLVFLPYFWTGLICNPKFPWKKLRLAGIAALVTAFALIVCIGNDIPVKFLYQATPYEHIGKGVLLRLVWYLLGGSLGLFLLAFIPTRRLPFTKAGANTMPAYLIHAPIVLYLRELNIQWPLYIIFTVVFLYSIYLLVRWHSSLYGIVPTERRDSRWLPFKKSTKNTLSPFIDSYYP
jgi:fucose 4-O-acetylase-like acetyltransferase